MKNKIKFFTIFFSFLMLFGCKDKGNYSTIKSETTTQNASHKIVVNEFLDGGNYAYLNVAENGNKYWMAIPNTEVKLGETYYYDGGMVMKDFESKQLEKTFDEIIFADGIRTTEKAEESNQANPHTNVDATTDIEVNIEKPANGTSLQELYTDKTSFSGKSIIVKGKVVKVNNGILNKNWVHIVDGTEFNGKKDLGLTTLDSVKIGDIVTFKGTIVLDKDFGHGYIFPVLLEDAVIVK
ncbi:MAG: hypothetical protein PHW92_06560 [Lutibacter sp.]|nr:hypothetical protein [Lutibacter sp.]